jgi:hypothetical protein
LRHFQFNALAAIWKFCDQSFRRIASRADTEPNKIIRRFGQKRSGDCLSKTAVRAGN